MERQQKKQPISTDLENVLAGWQGRLADAFSEVARRRFAPSSRQTVDEWARENRYLPETAVTEPFQTLVHKSSALIAWLRSIPVNEQKLSSKGVISVSGVNEIVGDFIQLADVRRTDQLANAKLSPFVAKKSLILARNYAKRCETLRDKLDRRIARQAFI